MYINIHIETKRLILREWGSEDIQAFAALNQDPQVMEFFPGLKSLEESKAFIQKSQEHFKLHSFGWYAVELKNTGKFIGSVGLFYIDPIFPFAPAVEIGWRLAAQYWGYGYATEAARAVLRYGFTKFGFGEIVAVTVPNNLKSQRVMEKIGMIRDINGDFANPKLPVDHPLSMHVLYRITKDQWKNRK